MYSALIAFLLVLFFAVAFSLQNSEPVTIVFFTWTFQGSLVIVLLTALAFGVILTLLALLPSQFKKSRQITQQQKTIAQLEQSIDNLKTPSIDITPPT